MQAQAINVSLPRKTLNSLVQSAGSKIQGSKSLLKNAGKIDMNGVNFPPNIFFALMIGAVLIPRLMQAQKRDNGTGDEVREIFTRDIISMLTLTFAMKGLEGSIADTVSKKKGLVLLTEPAEGKNFLQKMASFMRPSGSKAMNKNQLKYKYLKFDDKESVKNLVTFLQEKGGNVAKALTFDKKSKGPLNALTEEVFGKNISEIPVKDIIKKLDDDKIAKKYIDILSDADKNPLYKFCKSLNTGLWVASLGIIVAFLGFGLPKLNAAITNNKYKGKGGELKAKYEDPNSLPLYGGSLRAISKAEKQIFGAFLGYKA